MGLVISLLLICFSIFIFVSLFKADKNKGNMTQFPFEHIEGLKFINPKEIIGLHLEEKLKFIKSKTETIKEIDYSEIDNLQILTEVEQTDKSVIGRAIAGGLILGVAGAVVGGMSGTTKGKKNNYYLEITPKNDNPIILKPFWNSENIANIAKENIINKIKVNNGEC